MRDADRRWVRRLSSEDLAFLVNVSRRSSGRSRAVPVPSAGSAAARQWEQKPSGGEFGAGIARLREDPELTDRMLADERVFDALFGNAERDRPITAASPFLVFAVAVTRSAKDLRDRPYVVEWAGPGQRLPVFGAKELSAFLEDPARRCFLAALLASYTHVASGTVWVSTRRGPRRRRYSELDPFRLAALLEVLPEEEHPGVYRRLGDLALFLTGVFPDHTAGRSLRPLDLSRLARAVDAAGAPSAEELSEALAVRGAVGLLETLGQRWYRLAARGGDDGALTTLADEFSVARRALNHVTDRYLFPYRGALFPAEG